MAGETFTNGSLKQVSRDRLACLQRHWAWTDAALARFDHELAQGWDPVSLEEHPHIVTLLRDDERLNRLRRLHTAFGNAPRDEHVSQEFDALDTDR